MTDVVEECHYVIEEIFIGTRGYQHLRLIELERTPSILLQPSQLGT